MGLAEMIFLKSPINGQQEGKNFQNQICRLPEIDI